MRNKKLANIFILIVFIGILVFSFIFTFNIKKIDMVFNFSSKQSLDYCATCSEKIDIYKGKNLLFTNTNDIKSLLEEDTYLKVNKVEKKYPSTIFVDVEQRREVYLFSYESKTYVLDENGFVLAEKNNVKKNNGHEYINLSFEGIEILSLSIGKNILTDSEENFSLALSLAKQADLTDRISSLKIAKKPSTKIDDYGYQTVLTCETYTNVIITIFNSEFKGKEKVSSAFSAYDNCRDYQKSNNEITVTDYMDIFRVVWKWEVN